MTSRQYWWRVFVPFMTVFTVFGFASLVLSDFPPTLILVALGLLLAVASASWTSLSLGERWATQLLALDKYLYHTSKCKKMGNWKSMDGCTCGLKEVREETIR